MAKFSDDLEYWGIDEIYLEMCCVNKFTIRKEAVMDEMKKELLNIKKEEPDEFPETRCGHYMRFLWVSMYCLSIYIPDLGKNCICISI